MSGFVRIQNGVILQLHRTNERNHKSNQTVACDNKRQSRHFGLDAGKRLESEGCPTSCFAGNGCGVFRGEYVGIEVVDIGYVEENGGNGYDKETDVHNVDNLLFERSFVNQRLEQRKSVEYGDTYRKQKYCIIKNEESGFASHRGDRIEIDAGRRDNGTVLRNAAYGSAFVESGESEKLPTDVSNRFRDSNRLSVGINAQNGIGKS